MKLNDLFDNEGPIFMGAKSDPLECSIGIIGANYDGTTSYKPGARFGPNAIRNASRSLEEYCPKIGKDLSELNYCDFGSINIGLNDTKSVINRIIIGTEYLLKNNLKPLLIGGEHSITIGAVSACVNKYPELVLIQLDAHADLRDSYLGNKYSHACTMRRCIDILPMKKIFQIGIRSGTRKEFELMHTNQQLIHFQSGNKNKHLLETLKPFKNHPIYLTVDLDWFDPSLISGTGTPEPGGFFWNDFETLIETLNQFQIIGADIVELSPDIDQSGLSSIVAAKIARTLIMTLDKNFPEELF